MQILAGRGVGGDIACGGDVVGRDRVAEQTQDAGRLDIADAGNIEIQRLEVRRVMDVGRFLIPFIDLAAGYLDIFPLLRSFEHAGIAIFEHANIQACSDSLADLLLCWPDIPQIDRTAVAFAERLLVEIDIDSACQCVGDHQWRRGEEIGLDQWVDASFEVAVARKDRCSYQVIAGDSFRHFAGQRTRVADAGRASVADHVESKLCQRVDQVGMFEIFGHDARSGRQAGLDVGLYLQSLFDGLLRQQACTDHDRRVGCVGARSYGRDDYGAMRHGHRPAIRAKGRFGGKCFWLKLEAALLDRGRQGFFECFLEIRHRHTILRTFGSRQRRDDRIKIELKRVGEFGVGGVHFAEESLRTHVGFGALDECFRTPGESHVAESFIVHGEEPNRRAVLGRHVGDRGSVGQRHAVQALAVEFNEFIHDAAGAQHLGHGQHQVSSGDAITEFAIKFETNDIRQQHVHRLAEHDRLRFNAADTPAQYSEAVDHGGMRVGAYERVGESQSVSAILLGHDHIGQILQVDLVDDAGHRRDDTEVAECPLSPFQEFITLTVALELDLGIAGQRVGGGEEVHLDGVVDNQVHRHERIDLLRVTAQTGYCGAHCGQVHDRRDSCEILHDDPRRQKRDPRAYPFRCPGGDVLDIGLGDLLIVTLPEGCLQHDADRKWKPLQACQPCFFQCIEAVDDVFLVPNL